MTIRIGIIFGGTSKEREISFAGGRTVYDNLNKTIFEAVPIFVDSFGNFILLKWEFIYKGSIRDFYPPIGFIPPRNEDFQLYAESLDLVDEKAQVEIVSSLGTHIPASELRNHFDIAFLCLHGANGEDGRIQGLFEYLQIPYSGSGILPSAIGMNKVVQKQQMIRSGFKSPEYHVVERSSWLQGDKQEIFRLAVEKLSFPMVVKSAHQGSSIGISILQQSDFSLFSEAIDRSLFIEVLHHKDWSTKNREEKVEFVRVLCDIREGIGIPVRSGKKVFHLPSTLMAFIEQELSSKGSSLLLESLDGESEVLIEGFIAGREFSCIVIEDEIGQAIALPPTEIRKGKELFDYRSKYLPGLSRKITPIDLPEEQINKIRKDCERLFKELGFNVYARIDGFINPAGEVFLNDPNTTSGMMPSSFFFHQAAEIGLNPSQFLTFIIRTSLAVRIRESMGSGKFDNLLVRLEELINLDHTATGSRIHIAVLFGGYSSERHISVESGRNIYEKLSSSDKYDAIPVFLTGSESEHILYKVPVNILLKDNADDIREKIENYSVHPLVQSIIDRCEFMIKKYTGSHHPAKPERITYKDLKKFADGVFIALHGRPGEDGSVQQKLEEIGLPYNGSDQASSEITIDKYRTNELLKNYGLLVAEHMLVSENSWKENKNAVCNEIVSRIGIPFIAKPVDDGCSSAVKKIKSLEELEAFAELIFRKSDELDTTAAGILHVKAKEEFPLKKVFLVEELISQNNATRFLEITGGMLVCQGKTGQNDYEVFEASEALSEGEVLSLEEKFLAGQGQNITPARYSLNKKEQAKISEHVKEELERAAKILGISGYCRIDAFVRIYKDARSEVIFIEVNSLPGMTPATCIFHQAAINGYRPYDFIDQILDYGFKKRISLNLA